MYKGYIERIIINRGALFRSRRTIFREHHGILRLSADHETCEMRVGIVWRVYANIMILQQLQRHGCSSRHTVLQILLSSQVVSWLHKDALFLSSVRQCRQTDTPCATCARSQHALRQNPFMLLDIQFLTGQECSLNVRCTKQARETKPQHTLRSLWTIAARMRCWHAELSFLWLSMLLPTDGQLLKMKV